MPKPKQAMEEKVIIEDDKMLQSPVESHFALTPVTNSASSSPANGFTGVVCTELLNEELDQLEKEEMKLEDLAVQSSQSDEKLIPIDFSIDALLSPTDENISMFTRINSATDVKEETAVIAEEMYKGEVS